VQKLVFSLFTAVIVLSACQKEVFINPVLPVKKNPCIEQKVNPSGRSYHSDSIVAYNCTEKHCGFLSLSTKNYWVYQDSLFSDGNFVSVKIDTLRYANTYRSLSDGLTWWKGTKNIGLPNLLYTNDSAIFTAIQLSFSPETTNAVKSYSLFAGDSVKYLTSFDDIRAVGRSVKINEAIKVPAGSFSNYLLFEKNANFFGSDQIKFLPGIGVLQYVQMRVPIGGRESKKQIVSTLIAYHLE
jgi:hypothetical protein